MLGDEADGAVGVAGAAYRLDQCFGQVGGLLDVGLGRVEGHPHPLVMALQGTEQLANLEDALSQVSGSHLLRLHHVMGGFG